MNTTSVDAYLQDGCGRCDRYRTPQCKVHRWTEALKALRALVLEAGLTEEMKWGSPCYTLGGRNVLMITSLTDCCTLSFFKGAAMKDTDGVLESPGPNSRYFRLLKFRSSEDVMARRNLAAAFVEQAIALERGGVEVSVANNPEPMPAELEARLEGDASLQAAFNALTPGRQRSYRLYVGGAKQSETRERRVDRCIPRILAGKGFNER